jgi:hypothetical protein
MDSLTERERKERAQVEDALRTYPLADTPPDFAGRVMARVQAEVPAPRFRVTWLDTLVSLVIPGTGMLLLVVWSSLPPQTAAYLQTRVVLLWQFLQRTRLDWAVLGVVLMIVGLLIGMTVRLLRPVYRRSRIVRTIS